MDQVLSQAKVEILPAAKIWDPQRAYEKRLGTTMAKDKGTGLFLPRSTVRLNLCISVSENKRAKDERQRQEDRYGRDER